MSTVVKFLMIFTFINGYVVTLAFPSSNMTSSFIRDYINYSEYQFSKYTVMICGGKEKNVLAQLSIGFKKLFLFRASYQCNILDWQILENPQGFILDMGCECAQSILRQANELKLFRKPYSWLLLATKKNESKDESRKSSSEDQFVNLFNLLELRVDTLMVLANFASNEKVYLTEIYRIHQTSPLITKQFGTWTAQQKLEQETHMVMALRRWNLNGTIINSTIVINHDASMDNLETINDKHHDSASRYSYSLISSSAIIFNFKVNLMKTSTWGTYKQGEWNGMVKDLLDRGAEVGCCPLFLTPQRLAVVDYLVGISAARLGFILKAPPLSYSSNLFTLPFSSSVWASSVSLIFITSILLYVTARNEHKVRKSADKDTLVASWSDIAMLNMGAICQQGCDMEPKKASGRMVTIILYLAVMFLYVSYSASIVSLLQSSDKSIKTFKDLLESQFECGAENIPYQKAWFQSAATGNDEARKKFYLKKMAPRGDKHANFMPVEEGIKRVRQGLYAFHVEVSPGYLIVQQSYTESEKCGIQEIPSFVQVPEPWIPMKKHTPYAEMFKIGVKVAKEVGLESRIRNRLYTKKPKCSGSGSTFVPVGLKDCYPVFLIFTYGVMSSLVLVFIEKLIFIRWSIQINKLNV